MKSLLPLLAVCICSAQTPATFRSDVQLINVGFTVRDAGGKLVENLTKDDFEIFEDGASQKTAFFARSVDVPLSLGLWSTSAAVRHRSSRRTKRTCGYFSTAC